MLYARNISKYFTFITLILKITMLGIIIINPIYELKN